MKKKINKPYVKQMPSRASAHEWVDVKDSLPETDVNVLCMMEYEGGDIFPVIRWISGYDDVVTDENGFALYPAEVRSLRGWRYQNINRLRTTDNGRRTDNGPAYELGGKLKVEYEQFFEFARREHLSTRGKGFVA